MAALGWLFVLEFVPCVASTGMVRLMVQAVLYCEETVLFSMNPLHFLFLICRSSTRRCRWTPTWRTRSALPVIWSRYRKFSFFAWGWCPVILHHQDRMTAVQVDHSLRVLICLSGVRSVNLKKSSKAGHWAVGPLPVVCPLLLLSPEAGKLCKRISSSRTSDVLSFYVTWSRDVHVDFDSSALRTISAYRVTIKRSDAELGPYLESTLCAYRLTLTSCHLKVSQLCRWIPTWRSAPCNTWICSASLLQ